MTTRSRREARTASIDLESAPFALDQITEMLLGYLAVSGSENVMWDSDTNMTVRTTARGPDDLPGHWVPLRQFLQQRHDPSMAHYTLRNDLRPCLDVLGIPVSEAFSFVTGLALHYSGELAPPVEDGL